MNRFHLVSYEHADAEVRELYDDYLLSTGSTSVPIWVQSLGSSPDLLRAYWERTKGSLLKGALPLLLKELIVFVVSVENGARYCSAAHAHAVLNLDKTLTFDQLVELTNDGGEAANLPETFRAAIDYTLAVTNNPNGVPDDVYERLIEADFTDDEIHEIQSVIDLGMMFNCYTSSRQLPLDPEYRPVLEPLAAA